MQRTINRQHSACKPEETRRVKQLPYYACCIIRYFISIKMQVSIN